MSDRVPIYKEGIFRRACVTCGVKTKEQIDHNTEDWTGFSEVHRYPDRRTVPQHYLCHDKSSCYCDVSMRRNKLSEISPHSGYQIKAIRSCKTKDLPAVLELIKLTGLFWDIGDKEEIFRKKLAYDQESIMVLEVGGKIIGTVTTTYDPWASFIWHLAVHPDCQNKGYGRELIAEAERRLLKRGTTSVNGYITPDNEKSV